MGKRRGVLLVKRQGHCQMVGGLMPYILWE
ncbi:Uncharacterised protein [Klebsiella quasipneumoniae]|nr:Uncharacterised protein [Klebsiella quasipneumoniae]